ncbi:MAG: hypothetical protein ACLUGY_08785 [Phocaeicola massiliensis]
MNISLLLLIALLLTACGTPKKLTTTQQDSTRIEIRETVIYVPDTVFVEIPAQTAERTTQDSTSHLENDYALSDARINPDGSLYHDLKTKPQEKPVPFDKPVEKKDSIIYRTQYIDREVTVEVERELSWWEKTQIYGFWGLVVILIIVYRKKIFALARRFI